MADDLTKSSNYSLFAIVFYKQVLCCYATHKTRPTYSTATLIGEYAIHEMRSAMRLASLF